MKKQTRFDTVEIQFYSTTISDNPGGMLGPSIELGSPISSPYIRRLSTYERARDLGNKKKRLYLSHDQRERMLKNADFSDQDIHKAMRKKNQLIRMRRRSARLGPVSNIKLRLQAEKRYMKVNTANRNLKELGKEDGSLFHDHSDVYNGWLIPQITLFDTC